MSIDAPRPMPLRHWIRPVAALAALWLMSPTARVALAASDRAADNSPGRTTALLRAAERAGLRAPVLQAALRAHARARAAGLTTRPLVTVIDYSLPSRARRLWVLDLARGRVVAHELVAHGRRTGSDVARHFSNRPGSLQSSLGTFLTGPTYHGKHGLSLRLRGLDAGLNDQAEARAIVVHGADYVSERTIRQLGRLGRSQGCPALSPAAARRVIDLIRDGTVLFAYYPAPALERTVARG